MSAPAKLLIAGLLTGPILLGIVQPHGDDMSKTSRKGDLEVAARCAGADPPDAGACGRGSGLCFSVTEIRARDSSVLLRVPGHCGSHALQIVELASIMSDSSPRQPAW
jgi:hypothetical protein